MHLPRTVRLAVLPSLALLPLLSCSSGEPEGSAVRRGDVAWARGDREEALAEYRLAVLQEDDDAEALVRAAHAFAREGRVDEAAGLYARAGSADPEYLDQAVSDLVRVARSASRRGDRFGMASAVQAALGLRPGISVPDLSLPLARHYARTGEFGRAVPFFQQALEAAPPDSAADILFEYASAHEEVGGCEEALPLFARYRGMISGARRNRADWHIGNCSLERAIDLRRRGQDDEALPHLETTIRVGEPQTRLAQAHFQKAEIHFERGECEAALEAYRQVLALDSGTSGVVVNQARERIDEIRFGRGSGLRGRSDGGC